MLNQADTRAKLIDPKLHEAGWEEGFISRECHLTHGRIRVVGDTHVREKHKKADHFWASGNVWGESLFLVELKDFDG